MKILQVNCVYKSGSTGKIVYDLHCAYKECGIESYVCYGRGADIIENNVYKTAGEVVSKGYNLISRFTGIQYGGSFRATNRLIHIIKRINPDIVHLHCINGFFVNIYSLLNYLKEQKIKTVLTLHAEFMYTGSCGYALDCNQWKNESGCKKCPQLREATGSYFLDRTHTAWQKMKKAFDGFDDIIIVSVSPWLEKRARESSILCNKEHKCVLNGIDTKDTFFYRDAQELRRELGLENKRIALHVTAAFQEFKGSNYILELAKRMPDVVFVVVGNRENIPQCPKNIIPIGRIEDQSLLAQYYSMADVTVLTSKKETFSMVCAESLACGTPVAGFKAGAPETISLPQYSAFCEYADIEQLEHLIENMLGNPIFADKEKISGIAVQAYSKRKMSSGYLEIYEGLINEN